MAHKSLTSIVALLSVFVVLVVAAATAGHHHDEEDEVRHDCALCTVGSLNPVVDAQRTSSIYPTAVPSPPPAPQGPPLCALYRAHLLSRAPPALV